MADVGSIRATLEINTTRFQAGMVSARQQMERTGQSARTVSRDIKAIESAAKVMGGALAVGLGLATKSAIDFEQGLANVASVSGASTDQLSKLSDAAKELSSTTAFSSTQILQGAEELIKAGLSMDQVLGGGGLAGALNLASAGGLDLAQAATIASTALNAFKKDGLDVAKTADIMSGAANNSASDISDLQLGLSQVSAVASGVGLSFLDTSTALAIFSNNGLKGKSCPLY